MRNENEFINFLDLTFDSNFPDHFNKSSEKEIEL